MMNKKNLNKITKQEERANNVKEFIEILQLAHEEEKNVRAKKER
jgi:hypothetical protein